VLDRVCDDAPSGADDFPAVANPNLVVVAAAGNGGDFVEQYPAAESTGGLIAVAASTSQDQLAAFSTRGSWIRVASPGQGITSTVPGGLFGTWSGTSMAAPLVAAEAALIHARFPSLRNTKIVDHIEKTSDRIDGPVSERIDIGKALTTTPELDDATPTPTPTPTPTATPTPTPTPTPSPAPVLLTGGNSNRAIALHSVLMTAEPFSLLTPNNFSLDQHTRIALFATNVTLLQGETLSGISVSAVDTRSVSYVLPVESLSVVPDFDWMSMVVVRLPDDTSLNGDLAITLTLRGLKSNAVFVAVRGGP
jgi:hypothetical protein